MIFNSFLYDWLVVSTPLKNMNVNWDYEIPNIWENKKWQPNRQPDNIHVIFLILLKTVQTKVAHICQNYISLTQSTWVST